MNRLVRGTSGPFAFDLIDTGTGIVAGTSYDRLHVDRLVGFVASDFRFAGSGATGQFSIAAGAIGLNAAAVPESSSAALLALGLLGIGVPATQTARSMPDAPTTTPHAAGACRSATACRSTLIRVDFESESLL